MRGEGKQDPLSSDLKLIVLKAEVLKGTSLEVQWLKFHASKAEDGVSVSCRGTKIPHALWPKIGGKAEVLSFDISDSHILYSEALFTYNQ